MLSFRSDSGTSSSAEFMGSTGSFLWGICTAAAGMCSAEQWQSKGAASLTSSANDNSISGWDRAPAAHRLLSIQEYKHDMDSKRACKAWVIYSG